MFFRIDVVPFLRGSSLTMRQVPYEYTETLTGHSGEPDIQPVRKSVLEHSPLVQFNATRAKGFTAGGGGGRTHYTRIMPLYAYNGIIRIIRV